MTLNGVGGTVVQDDDLSVTAATSNGLFTLTNGTWDSNGHSLTATNFVSTGAAARTFILGSALKVGGKITSSTSVVNVTASLTLNVASAGTLEILSTTTAIQAITFIGAGLTFPALVLDTNSNPHNFNITGNNLWTSWTVGPGWNVTLPGSGTQTISGALTVNGTTASPSVIANVNNSAVSTLAVTGTCTGTHAILAGLTFTTCVPAFTQTASYGGMTLNGGTITAPTAGGIVGIIGG